MTISKLSLALLCVLFISVGQILFKLASKDFQIDTISSFMKGVQSNYYLIVGLFIYAITTLLWIKLLKSVDLKVAYPVMALAFLIVPVLSHFMLDEKISMNTFIGAAFIVLGITISIR